MTKLTDAELADLTATKVMKWSKAWSPSAKESGWFEELEGGGLQS